MGRNSKKRKEGIKMRIGREKSPWGKLKKGDAARLKKVATTGLVGGRTRKKKGNWGTWEQRTWQLMSPNDPVHH